MESMSFGVMPDFEAFEAAFNRECPRGKFVVDAGNATSEAICEADGVYTAQELFDLVARIKDDFSTSGVDDGSSVASSIMYVLGFEWI